MEWRYTWSEVEWGSDGVIVTVTATALVTMTVAVTVTVAVAVAVDVDVAAILHITTRRVRDRRACR